MNSERSYKLIFKTEAELAGAKAAETAVAKVGVAAKKVEESAAEMSKRMMSELKAEQAAKEPSSKVVDDAANLGKAVGGAFSSAVEQATKGIQWTQDTQAAAKAAWDIGSLIGSTIGGAIERVYDRGLNWRAVFNLTDLKETQAESEAAIKRVYASVMAESETFWKTYRGLGDANAGSWIDKLKAKVDLAKAAMDGLKAVQDAVVRANMSRAEADAADKSGQIDADPILSTSAKMAAKAKVQEELARKQLEERKRNRANEASSDAADLARQKQNVEDLRKEEARRGLVATASQKAKAIERANLAGQPKADEATKAAIKKDAYNQAGAEYGVTLNPANNAEQDLMEVKKQRRDAEKALEKAAMGAANKAAVRKIEADADVENTEREIQRKRIATSKAVGEQIDKEQSAQNKADEEQRNAKDRADAIPDEAFNSPEQKSAMTDARSAVNAAAQSPSIDDATRARLAALQQDLQGSTASNQAQQQLESLANRLLESYQSSHNAAALALAEKITQAIRAMQSNDARVQQRLSELETAIQGLQNHP